jgi:hypothetical protein
VSETAAGGVTRFALPLFVSVTVCAALVVPTFCDANVRLAGESEAPGPVPVPDRLTEFGELAAFDATATEPLLAPDAVGLNVTDTLQVPAGATVPQVVVAAKSPAFVPPTVTPLTTRLALPVFVTVTVCAALVAPIEVEPNVRLAVDSETTGACATPVPWSGTVCGLPVALSAIDSELVRVPAACGLNVMLTVQLAPAATGVAGEQVPPEIAKSSPAIDRLLIVSGAVPLFSTVTDCAAEVEPTLVFANSRVVADDGVVVTDGAATAAVVLMVPSVNCSCSMFQRMSQPSPFGASWMPTVIADLGSQTVIEPSGFIVMV